MRTFTDQLGRKITLADTPERIVSLVPSQTELLYDLGLQEEIAGITKFCIHPDEWFKTKTRVGGTKKINFEKIRALNPDLVIGNKEENDKSQLEELMKHYPVWISNIKNLEGALQMIEQIGALTGKEENSYQLKSEIEQQFNAFNSRTILEKTKSVQPKTAYLIWDNPLITIGRDTFIQDMLARCGFKNIFDDRTRYPEIKEEELATLCPDLILLSSEPFPFKEKHMEKFRSLCPDSKVMLADGEFFSWYGSRLLKAPNYFNSLIEQIGAGD